MATAALVGVTTGVMKPLLSKLTKLLEEECVKLKGVRKQIKFLRDELSAMSATLQMLADADQLDPETREWRDKLRELAYELEDCVDAFMVRVDHEPARRSVFKRFSYKLNRLKARHEIANQMEELKACVIEASERHKRYDLAQLKSKSSSSFVDPRLQALYEDIDKLVGIDAPKKHIIKLLNMEMDASSAKLKVVSISGCGGIGKTTLAKQVYDTIKGQFECSLFVSVSRTPDVRKILIHIADGVKCTGINTQDDGEQQLIDKLRKHLQDKRYIVVIDDVWNTEDWGFLKLALPDNDCGSRIIMTTRSVTVAKCSSQVHEMEALSFDDSKRLFFRRVFGSENSCYPHLKDVPKKILRKCGGLPLAIVTVSGILTNVFAKAEWDRVFNVIGSALAKNPGAENMTAILSMSYFDIPHHLRTCLLYVSMFPEDYEIEKQCLINRWIAEGFIQEIEGQTKYETGEGYFNDLINRSMIQPVNVKYGQAKACLVHDIVLDYIKCKAAEENFVTSVDVVRPVCTSENGYTRIRRLYVSNHKEENVTIWEDQILSHVRSVTIFGQPVKISLLRSNALRVLDLGGCRGIEDHHLASIGNLFNLKYLRLSSFSIRKLPENVGELQHLQTLDVRQIKSIELPQTIVKLQQLARLYVNLRARFPEGTIGKMHNLEELSMYGVQSYEHGKSIQELCKLTKLRTLEIAFNFHLPNHSTEGRSQTEVIHTYVGNLLTSCNLHNLIFICDNSPIYPLALHAWHPAAFCSIRKLCIEGPLIYGVPNWMGSLGNLGFLELKIMFMRPEDVEILGEIPGLRFLNLGTMGGTGGRIVFPCNNGFKSLRYFSLCIFFCGTSLEFEAGSMSKLEHMKLEFHAHEMKCLNGSTTLGIQHLSSLSKVEIKIYGDEYTYYRSGNPLEDNYDDTVKYIARAINAAIETLPNRPTAMFQRRGDYCNHFKDALEELRELNQSWEGLLDEWLEIWQIREEHANQAIDGETELEDQNDNDEEGIREKEVAH